MVSTNENMDGWAGGKKVISHHRLTISAPFFEHNGILNGKEYEEILLYGQLGVIIPLSRFSTNTTNKNMF